MPGRKVPLVTNHIYHIYNRGVAKMLTFFSSADYNRCLDLINYYQNAAVPLKYSSFLELPSKRRFDLVCRIRSKRNLLVRIYTFVLMPNHFHFMMEQLVDGGISKFMSNFENSYTRYINVKNDRVGPLYQGKFKSVLVKTEEQFIHLSRYHHLNVFTSGVVNTTAELLEYPYSSLANYVNISSMRNFVDSSRVLSHFKSRGTYKKFVLNHADYQRKLQIIKNLTLE